MTRPQSCLVYKYQPHPRNIGRSRKSLKLSFQAIILGDLRERLRPLVIGLGFNMVVITTVYHDLTSRRTANFTCNWGSRTITKKKVFYRNVRRLLGCRYRRFIGAILPYPSRLTCAIGLLEFCVVILLPLGSTPEDSITVVQWRLAVDMSVVCKIKRFLAIVMKSVNARDST